MKSGLARLMAKGGKNGQPPVPLSSGFTNRTNIFDLGAGSDSIETYLRAYKRSGTVFSIVSLLAQSAAMPKWRLYKKQVDGRRRYATTDKGDDDRIEVTEHPALTLWNHPNEWHSGFEFREGSNQHMELAGETFWIMDNDTGGFPVSMWYINPQRMMPITSAQDYLLGWVYTGPNGDQIPLDVPQVIQEKLPNPADPYRGMGPVASIMPNIDQQHYATEYQRNLFLNGAEPGGIIQVDQNISEPQWEEFVARWREAHQGVARAGRIAVLESGMTWVSAGSTNKDLEYGQLRLSNRDEIREAFRMHKSMLGTVEDVNRANAQTAEETFSSWQQKPRLERRKNTLNHKLLPLFGDAANRLEFDYDDPSPVNQEAAVAELHTKATAAAALVSAGWDPDDVLEAVGLPAMDVAEKATQMPALPPGWVAAPAPGTAPSPDSAPDESNPGVPAATAREVITLLNKKSDAAAAAYQQEAADFPPGAMAWMHHASWKGPVKVPISHINPEMPWMDEPDPDHVAEFAAIMQAGKKVRPVILVKVPGSKKLKLVDGHHRYLAADELAKPVKAYIGTVDSDDGEWSSMHSHQFSHPAGKGGGGDMAAFAEVMLAGLRPYTARALPAAAMNRSR